MIKAEHCDNKNWRLDKLDSIVEEEVSQLLFSPGYYQSLVERHAAEVKAAPRRDADIIRDKVAEVDRQIGRMMDLYQDEKIPVDVLSARIDKLHREKVALEAQLAAVAPPKPQGDYDEAVFPSLLADCATVWRSAGQEEKRQIISTLIRRISLDGEHVDIEWAFLE